MSDALQRLSELGRLLVQQQDRVKDLERQLKEAKTNVNRTEMEDLPQLMTELGIPYIGLEDGRQLTLKEDCSAAITEANREEAIRWLVDHGHGGLVKTEVAVRFGRGDHDTATQVCDNLAREYDEVQLVEKVHPSTLKAWVRERMEEGEDIPMDLFSVHPYQKAVVTKR